MRSVGLSSEQFHTVPPVAFRSVKGLVGAIEDFHAGRTVGELGDSATERTPEMPAVDPELDIGKRCPSGEGR